MESTPKWLVQRSDGTVFGPVPLAELCAWAREGRVGPEDNVSPDGDAWRPAQDIDELEMVWQIELPDGTLYGPLNGFALAGLLQDQSLGLDLAAQHVEDGRRLPAPRVALEMLLADRASWEEQVLDLRVELLHAKEQAARNQEAVEQVQALRRENEAARGRAEEADGIIVALEQQLAEAQRAAADAQAETGAARREIRDLETRLTDREAARKAGEERVAQLEADLAARSDQEDKLEEVSRARQAAEQALEEARTLAREEANRSASRIEELEQRCDLLRGQAAEALEQKAEEARAAREEVARSSGRAVQSAVKEIKSKAAKEARKSSMSTTAYKRRKAARVPRKGH